MPYVAPSASQVSGTHTGGAGRSFQIRGGALDGVSALLAALQNVPRHRAHLAELKRRQDRQDRLDAARINNENASAEYHRSLISKPAKPENAELKRSRDLKNSIDLEKVKGGLEAAATERLPDVVPTDPDNTEQTAEEIGFNNRRRAMDVRQNASGFPGLREHMDAQDMGLPTSEEEGVQNFFASDPKYLHNPNVPRGGVEITNEGIGLPLSSTSGTDDSGDENVPEMRSFGLSGAQVVPDAQGGIHEGVAENSSPYRAGQISGAGSLLRQGVPATGQDKETGLPRMWQRQVANASRGLRQTAGRDLALSSLPSGAPQEPGILSRFGHWLRSDNSEQEAIDNPIENSDIAQGYGHEPAPAPVAAAPQAKQEDVQYHVDRLHSVRQMGGDGAAKAWLAQLKTEDPTTYGAVTAHLRALDVGE